MPNIKDPTRTITIRRSYERMVSRMFNDIKRFMRKLVPLVLTNNVTSLINQEIPAIDPRNFLYKTDEEKIREFNRWMTGFINGLFYNEVTGRSDFLDRLLQDGFNRGRNAAALKLQAELGISGLATPIATSTTSTGVAGFVAGSFSQIKSARLLYTRTYTQLQGITENMGRTLSSNLASAVLSGDGIDKTVRTLSDKVDIDKRRVQRVVRTEIAHAHNIGSIEEGKSIALSLGVETPKFVWITTLDGRERPEHNAWNGRLFTEQEALSRLGSPNCRCAVTLRVPREDLPERVR